MGWRGRGRGMWPGRGPFSYLPPWQRPGWLYGRGACWWLYNPLLQATAPPISEQAAVPPIIPTTQFAPTTPVPPTVALPPFAPAFTKEQEVQMLEQYAGNLETQLNEIKKRLEALRK